MAISAGVLEPMLRPTGRRTRPISAGVTPSSAGAATCAAGCRGFHDADPARVAGKRVAEHRAKLGPVVVGDHHVGPPVRVAAPDGVLRRGGEVADGRGPLGVGLDKHWPVAGIAAVAEAGDG